ncbi:MAG: hypothetical protein WCJ37_07300 [Syntrophus sp. (in: bacteria)]
MMIIKGRQNKGSQQHDCRGADYIDVTPPQGNAKVFAGDDIADVHGGKHHPCVTAGIGQGGDRCGNV